MGMGMRCFVILSVLIFFIINSTTIVMATSAGDCRECHLDNYNKWNDSPHYTKPFVNNTNEEVVSDSPECEICHQAPIKGFEAHITTPSEAIPGSNISVELCGNCHTGQHEGVYMEWNEYDNENFDFGTMESHSEPSAIDEGEVLKSSTCVSCKSTEGAILNIEDGDIYDQSEDIMPEPEDITEWRITCVACHEPHSTELRITSTQLCASCHNSGASVPDGNTTIVRYAQWEMYNGSIYTNDVHAVELECVDCHMATMIEENKTTITGHSFDIQPLLLSDPNSGNICKKCHVVSHDGTPVDNECDDCHDISLSNIIAVDQKYIRSRLQMLEVLEENASIALTMINDSSGYQKQFENYNNALFYMNEVESDGSFGVHNMERATDDLDMAESLFNSVIEEATGISDRGRTAIPGFGIITGLSIVTGMGLGFSKKEK